MIKITGCGSEALSFPSLPVSLSLSVFLCLCLSLSHTHRHTHPTDHKFFTLSENKVAQSCPILSDPMDCSLPGSSTDEISQARVLEWGAIAFSGKEDEIKGMSIRPFIKPLNMT